MSVIDYTEPVIDYSERKEQVRQAVRRYQQRFSASGVYLNPRFQGTPFAHRHVVARFIAATVY